MSFSTCSCVLWQNEQRSGLSELSFLTAVGLRRLPWWDKARPYIRILEPFSIRGIGYTISLLTVRYALAMLVNNFVDQAVILGLLRRHNEIAFDVFLDFVHRLLAMIGQELVDDRTHAQNFFCMNINVSSLSRQAGHPGLMNQNTRVGERKTFFRSSRSQQQSGNRSRLPHTGGDHVRPNILHRIVDGHARSDRAARRIDIELDIALRIFGFQEAPLGSHEVGYVVVDRRSNK